MPLVDESAFSRRVASHPSTTGIDRSIRIRSGFRRFALSIASTPFCASATLNPQNFRYSPYISRASAKSSTTSTNGSLLLFVDIGSFIQHNHVLYFRRLTGRVRVKTDPCPSLLSTFNVPRSIVVSRRQIDKPRPVPP